MCGKGKRACFNYVIIIMIGRRGTLLARSPSFTTSAAFLTRFKFSSLGYYLRVDACDAKAAIIIDTERITQA